MSPTVQIVKTPDVFHGKPRLERTRVGVLQIGELVRERDRSTDTVRRKSFKNFATPGWRISLRSYVQQYEKATDQLGLDAAQVSVAVEY